MVEGKETLITRTKEHYGFFLHIVIVYHGPGTVLVVLLVVIYFGLTVGWLSTQRTLCVGFDVSISGWQALAPMVSEFPVSSV